MHKGYPKQHVELTWDPLLLLQADRTRQEEETAEGRDDIVDWSGFYLTPLGNVLSWTPCAHARTSLDVVAKTMEVFEYEEDQPGDRLVQRGPQPAKGLTP